MNELGRKIAAEIPGKDELFLYWLGGAGFILRTVDLTVGLDVYLSNACMRENGEFKRLVPPPLTAADLDLDYLIASHEHGDHLDKGSICTFLGEDTRTLLIGPGSVIRTADQAGVKKNRLIRLDRNESLQKAGLNIKAVFADHGELSPDAIGLIIEIGGRRIYFTGDTCFRVDLPQLVPIADPIDLLLVPINGQFGNPDARDASYITAWVRPKTVIPCHFWLFREHGGDPGEFFRCCSAICPSAKMLFPMIGEQVKL